MIIIHTYAHTRARPKHTLTTPCAYTLAKTLLRKTRDAKHAHMHMYKHAHLQDQHSALSGHCDNSHKAYY